MNLYQALGVSPGASVEQIRHAYLEAARVHHPDFHLGEPDARDLSKMPGFKTIPQGAATSVWAATAPQLEGRGGGYLADVTEATKPKAWALDPAAAQRLWAMSEKMVGETFAF